MNEKRRALLRLAGAAGAVGLASLSPKAASAKLETTRVRLHRYPFDVTCIAPTWVAEELLRSEGFTDVQYIETTAGGPLLATGEIDFSMSDVFSLLLLLDAGKPIVFLAGVHSGCFELFAAGGVKSIRDLKGRTVSVASLGRKAFVAAMAAHVGLDPRKDLTFASHPAAEAISLLEKGEIDAMLGFPPDPQELRARKIGHSIVNTTTDRPWSQYFCCIVAGNREFVRSNPVATKAVIRSFLKAASVCAREPERIARLLTDRGFIKQYEYGVQALKEIPYNRWREFDSADTIRYYALRLHETGMIKSTPQSLLAAGTDWRFLEERKPELKG
jgi:NitT/TauT family transport system substrate-binding protein